VLETLSPPERLAFVLHDMFAIPFDEIAALVGCTPAAARQLASRARRRVQGAAVPDVDLAGQRELVDAFLAAARNADFDALVAVLDADVVLRIDRGARPRRASREVRGAVAVAERGVVFSRLAPYARPALINGVAGFVVVRNGRPLGVAGFTVAHSKIVEIDLLMDPARLRELDLTDLDDTPRTRHLRRAGRPHRSAKPIRPLRSSGAGDGGDPPYRRRAECRKAQGQVWSSTIADRRLMDVAGGDAGVAAVVARRAAARATRWAARRSGEIPPPAPCVMDHRSAGPSWTARRRSSTRSGMVAMPWRYGAGPIPHVPERSQPSGSPTFHRIVRGSPQHASSESSPPRQRGGGGERGGTGVAEQESRGSRVGNPQPERDRCEGGRRAGADQADPSGCIAVDDRA
jgi:hypothetical protein